MKSKHRDLLTIIFLGMAGGSIFTLPYLKYVFYEQMLDAMHISGQQIGMMITVFAIACTINQIPGGIISDRISSRKTILWSLFTTCILIVAFAFTFTTYFAALIIWFLLAFTTIFLCWPAVTKTVRAHSKEIGSGTAFGIYHAVCGLTGAIINLIALHVYSLFPSPEQGFLYALIVLASYTIIIMFALTYLLRDEREGKGNVCPGEQVRLADVKNVLASPTIWLISSILFCTYTIYIAVTYFNPYLIQTFHITEKLSGNLTIIRLYVFTMLAPISGMLADRLFHSTLRWFIVGLGAVFMAVGSIYLFESTLSAPVAIALTLIAALFMVGLYCIMYSIINECRIPDNVSGTAIGIISVFAFLPDLIAHTLFGKLIDMYGTGGYHYIFMIMLILSVVTCSCTIILLRSVKKQTSVLMPKPQFH
ncbi:MFS transporter [Bacillus sp. 1P06AnD]|uniref:MFS transporter n=1 Tax=Bacillus sp. 1P06AnD TaxID=3132208 RepID=UPI0039A3714E